MDRLVRARVPLAEAQALGVTIDDLVAASTNAPRSPSATPTVAEYVETVVVSFSNGTGATYKSYWRLAVDRLGDRPGRSSRRRRLRSDRGRSRRPGQR